MVVHLYQEESQDGIDPANTSHLSVDEEVSIKEEPLSPASSVSSKISESDIRKERRYSRGMFNPFSIYPLCVSNLIFYKDDETSRLSDPDSSDDGGMSDDTSTSNILNISTSAFSESIPNSPLSHCSDTEDEKAYKNWKKSIMLVWRSAANHKYANVFLHPVTNEIAPGYTTVVQRPMDLSLIKKKVESGEIRTTVEFQRDMMLMFTNAIMYNSSNHDVHKMATIMYDEVLQQIEQYVSTQLMVQGTDSKYLRGSRRADNSDKEDDTKRRRTSSEQHGDGGKSKKRKTRADDV
ncbi:hypothetical protein FSP39_015554 [Pinctada imbricata]|uniref:Bromo domain-containing protein n=1 Tax=Pinctada imbricata TaxID=66713 RepID=A0AA88YAL0_PINIB|nr:hypothetical protein FSP39_015554 [Pinctada imbricata]